MNNYDFSLSLIFVILFSYFIFLFFNTNKLTNSKDFINMKKHLQFQLYFSFFLFFSVLIVLYFIVFDNFNSNGVFNYFNYFNTIVGNTSDAFNTWILSSIILFIPFILFFYFKFKNYGLKLKTYLLSNLVKEKSLSFSLNTSPLKRDVLNMFLSFFPLSKEEIIDALEPNFFYVDKKLHLSHFADEHFKYKDILISEYFIKYTIKAKRKDFFSPSDNPTYTWVDTNDFFEFNGLIFSFQQNILKDGVYLLNNNNIDNSDSKKDLFTKFLNSFNLSSSHSPKLKNDIYKKINHKKKILDKSFSFYNFFFGGSSTKKNIKDKLIKNSVFLNMKEHEVQLLKNNDLSKLPLNYIIVLEGIVYLFIHSPHDLQKLGIFNIYMDIPMQELINLFNSELDYILECTSIIEKAFKNENNFIYID